MNYTVKFAFGTACVACLTAYVFSDGADESAEQQSPSNYTASSNRPASTSQLSEPPEIGDTGNGVSLAEVHAANLDVLLNRFASDHRDAARQSVIAELKGRMNDFNGALYKILQTKSHPLLKPAIEIAGILRLETTISHLRMREIDAIPKIRAAAIRALAELDNLQYTDISRLLRDRHEVVLVAALKAAKQCAIRPTNLISRLLSHDDHNVRVAAIASMPEMRSGPQLTRLCRKAITAHGQKAVAYATALGQTGLPRAAEQCLNQLVAHPNSMVREAALNSLAKKTSPLLVPDIVLTHLRNPDRTAEEQAAAFIALEKTKTLPIRKLRNILDASSHPVSRLLAARCLIVAGDASAISTLIELLECEETDNADDEAVSCARLCAREALVELSEHDYGEHASAWRPWQRRLGRMTPQTLTSQPPDSW
jgi:HEAT repeat protein